MRHSTTTHPVSWFSDRDREGNLSLQPNFQRRSVWSNSQKSRLIESVLLELPIPEIFMQIKTDPDGNSEYIVVDGQQRITALLEFASINGREPFALTSLGDSSDWLHCTFSDLDSDQRAQFFGHPMAVRNLQDVTDSEIEDLFRRLNKYSTPLNRQELRNATYKGPFLKLSQTIAEDEFWTLNGLASPLAIRRMRDIEFVSDLLIGVLDGPQSANARTIDSYYALFERYKRQFRGQRECRRRFDRTLELAQRLWPNLRPTRWSNKTDFYSLFVAMAHLLRDHDFPSKRAGDLAQALGEFENDVAAYQKDERHPASDGVVAYVEAMRRGSSDRHRRGVRHTALLHLISDYFEKRDE